MLFLQMYSKQKEDICGNLFFIQYQEDKMIVLTRQ